MPFDPQDIIGRTYGKLTVGRLVRHEPPKKPRGPHRYFYECACECGNTIEMLRANIVTHHTKSCGCLKQIRGKDSPSWTGFGEISGRAWYAIETKARERGLEFSITIQDAWKKFLDQKRRCALTGEKLTIDKVKVNGTYTYPTASLDRIDNTKGYVTGNIQWLHKDINWMKGRFTATRFVELCTAVASHSTKRKRSL